MSRSLLVFVFDADPDIPELIELLQSKYGAVTATRFEFENPIVPVPAWWEILPRKAKLRVIRDNSDVWYDTARARRHSNRALGSIVDYHNLVRDGMLRVYSGPFDLWMSPGDVEPVI